MKARELFQAGKLDEAIEALGAELRDNPLDAQRRTFLFELLCFAGRYDRAEKQLDVLARGGQQAEMGALLYRSALHAERTRQAMFEGGNTPPASAAATPVAGTLNGERFTSLADADPRVGPRLELFAAGQYTWIPLAHVASVRVEAPRRLRDLLWAPAIVKTGPLFRGVELGEVLIPVLAPLSWKHPDGNVRLGRVTEWQELDGGGADDEPRQAPVGQKLFLVDGEAEFPLLEIRELVIDAPAS
ncbi:MAG TPA: type VI secretion system accessory protein TagJ [Gemmatimonadaceae bacterium]|nr:type VI secretion system accessory protein TagJ [Gemmatimonadaceae bacterium]